MNRQHLIDVLERAKPFLMTQDFIPILTCFCFDLDHVTAYNDIQGVRLNLKTDLHCGVPGQLMLKLLDTLTAENVELYRDATQVRIRSARTNATLPSKDPSEFVFEIPNFEGIEPVGIPGEVLAGLEKCLVSVGSDPTHQERNGVTWVIETDQVTLYSTDNKTISRFLYEDSNVGVSKGASIACITPTFFCEQLVALAKTFLPEGGTVSMYFTEQAVVADIENKCRLFTRLIHTEEKPDYEAAINRVLPTPAKVLYSPIPDDLESALTRASLLLGSGEEAKASSVKVKGQEMDLFTSSAYGTSEDAIGLGHEVGQFNFSVDPQLLLRAFKVTDKMAILPNLVSMVGSDGNFLHLISHSRT